MKKQIKLIDADSVEMNFETRLDTFQNQVEIVFEKVEKAKYQMSILPDAVKDFYGNTNDTINVNLQTKSKADL